MDKSPNESPPVKKARYDPPNLCNSCRLQVVHRTLDLQEVIMVFQKAGRSFCSCLGSTIITTAMQERIRGAGDDLEALGLIRQALDYSLEPRKLDIVLEVLSQQQVLIAEKIKKYYYQEIRKHKCCEKCNRGNVERETAVDNEARLQQGREPQPKYKMKQNIDAHYAISGHRFSYNERTSLLSCKFYNHIIFGETGAGKNSLAWSLTLETSCLTSAYHCIFVADFLRWNPNKKEDTIHLIYDFTWHRSSKSMCKCFQVNDSTTLRLQCHDITFPNNEASTHRMKETQTVAPYSKIIFSRPKVNKLITNVNKESKIQPCLDTFSRLIDPEIQQTKDSQKLTAKEQEMWASQTKNDTSQSLKLGPLEDHSQHCLQPPATSLCEDPQQLPHFSPNNPIEQTSQLLSMTTTSHYSRDFVQSSACSNLPISGEYGQFQRNSPQQHQAGLSQHSAPTHLSPSTPAYQFVLPSVPLSVHQFNQPVIPLLPLSPLSAPGDQFPVQPVSLGFSQSYLPTVPMLSLNPYSQHVVPSVISQGTATTQELYHQQQQQQQQAVHGTDRGEITFEHPVLQEHKEELVDKLNLTCGLVEKLIERNVLASNVGSEILQDIQTGSCSVSATKHRVEMILGCIKDSRVLRKFIEVLIHCPPTSGNTELGRKLEDCFDAWCDRNAGRP